MLNSWFPSHPQNLLVMHAVQDRHQPVLWRKSSPQRLPITSWGTWVRQWHKPSMTGNRWNPTYKKWWFGGWFIIALPALMNVVDLHNYSSKVKMMWTMKVWSDCCQSFLLKTTWNNIHCPTLKKGDPWTLQATMGCLKETIVVVRSQQVASHRVYLKPGFTQFLAISV